MPRDRDEFDIDDASTRLAKHSSGARASITIPQGLSVWKPKKSGTHTIEIIPYKVTDAHLRFPPELQFSSPGKWYFERTFYTHAGIGVNNESFTCPARTLNRPCPVCEHRQTLKDTPKGPERDLFFALKPKDRQMFLIYDLDDTDRGVQLWEVANWNFGRHLDKHIEGARKQDRDAYRRFYHPTEGYTLRLTATEVAIGTAGKDTGGKAGGGMNTEYTVHGFFLRERDIPREILHHGYDLDSMVRVLDYDALRAVFRGVTEDVDEETNGRPARRSTERGVTVNDDGPADDGHPEPPPARAGRTKAAEPPPVPDEETYPLGGGGGPGFATNDVVSYMGKDGPVEGTVKKIDTERRVAHVQVDGRERPAVIDFEDLTLVERDTTFDQKPEAPPAARGRAGKPRPEPEPPARNTGGRRSGWDDDEEDDGRSAPPPAAKAKRPAKDEEAPAPATRKRGK